MALQLNLEKSAQKLTLDLSKRGVQVPPVADLAFVLDVSSSFRDEHEDGSTQMLLERLVPWGMVFDPDKKLDVFTFSHQSTSAHYVGEISPDVTDGYIRREIVGRVPGWCGGTDYSYVLECVMRRFGWLTDAPPRGSGFLKSLFARKRQPERLSRRRSIVLFVTDGDNGDKTRTEQVLSESQARRDEIYFLFIAISNRGGTFPFLDEVRRNHPNAGLRVISDLRALVNATDDEVNNMLLDESLIQWLNRPGFIGDSFA